MVNRRLPSIVLIHLRTRMSSPASPTEAANLLARRRNIFPETNIIPQRINLSGRIAAENFRERTLALVIEVNRHFGIGIHARRVADPAPKILRQQSFAGLRTQRRKYCG